MYFPILILKTGEKINEFISLFIKEAKDLDIYSPFFNAKNREENLIIKKGEESIFIFSIFELRIGGREIKYMSCFFIPIFWPVS